MSKILGASYNDQATITPKIITDHFEIDDVYITKISTEYSEDPHHLVTGAAYAERMNQVVNSVTEHNNNSSNDLSIVTGLERKTIANCDFITAATGAVIKDMIQFNPGDIDFISTDMVNVSNVGVVSGPAAGTQGWIKVNALEVDGVHRLSKMTLRLGEVDASLGSDATFVNIHLAAHVTNLNPNNVPYEGIVVSLRIADAGSGNCNLIFELQHLRNGVYSGISDLDGYSSRTYSNVNKSQDSWLEITQLTDNTIEYRYNGTRLFNYKSDTVCAPMEDYPHMAFGMLHNGSVLPIGIKEVKFETLVRDTSLDVTIEPTENSHGQMFMTTIKTLAELIGAHAIADRDPSGSGSYAHKESFEQIIQMLTTHNAAHRNPAEPTADYAHKDTFVQLLDLITTAQNTADAANNTAGSHDHDERYYTEGEVNTALGGKSDTSHLHDDRYYTEGEMDTALANKSNVGHGHSYAPSVHSHTVTYRGQRSSTGPWTITGLSINIPLFIVLDNVSNPAVDCKVRFRVTAGGYGGSSPANIPFALGADNDNPYQIGQAIVIIPSSGTVTITIDSIAGTPQLRAYS